MDILLFTTRLCIIACRHMVPYYYKGKHVKASEIAELYNFKVRSLSPSFTVLVKAGILSSQVGGRERGFIFALDPKTITLYDITHALEGESQIDFCEDALNCQPLKCEDCSINHELRNLIEARRVILSSTTIYKHYESKREMEEKKNINI